MSLHLGIDFGTSGVRTAVIDEQCREVAFARTSLPPPNLEGGRPVQDPDEWWRSLERCLDSLSSNLAGKGRSLAEVAALAVDGTSGTVLLADSQLRPVTAALMYNSSGFLDEAREIDAVAPENSIARGASSALARLMHLQSLPTADTAAHAMHQADWIAAKLIGSGGFSDENNVLKAGYDLETGGWPEDWFGKLGMRMELLPRVKPAGRTIGTVRRQVCDRFGFAPGTQVAAGTTDSIAAFIASGASNVGDGVTSVGTTLVIKLLSEAPVTDVKRGVYSHRIFGMWLAGGASNTGGGALLKHFPLERIVELSARVDPETDSGLRYYPLPQPGERFPVSDPGLQPIVSPRPRSDVTFLQGLFEGLARIERSGYDALRELGAPAVTNVRSVGGGSGNRALNRIRERTLGRPVSVVSADAAVGSALIARRSCTADGPAS